MSNNESLGNFKKKYTVSIVFLIIVTVLAIGSEIFTTKYVSDQKKKINQSIANKNKTSTLQSEIPKLITLQMQNESKYIQALEKVMSEKELQNFKSNLVKIAAKQKINLSIKNDAPVRKIKDYEETKFLFESVSTYDAYKKFKEEIAKLNYFINFDKEIVKRENETSKQIKVNGELHVIVFSKKEEIINEFNKKIPNKKSN